MTTSISISSGGGDRGRARRCAPFLAALVFGMTVIQCAPAPKEEQADDLSDLVLGKVADTEFTVGDLRDKLDYQFRGRFDGLSGQEAVTQHRQLVEQGLTDLCWVTLGEKKGYTKEKAFQATWELSRRYILAQVTISQEIEPYEEPTAEEIDAYYQENLSQFQIPTRVQLAHVQLNTKKDAEAVRAMLERGEPVAEVAARHSLDERTKTEGGLLGWVTATSGIGHFGRIPAVNEAAMKLMKGDVSRPVELTAGRGWSVLYALDRTEAGPRPLDDALRETIRERAKVKKHNTLYEQRLGQLKEDYRFEFNEENFGRYAASLMTEEDLFNMAQRSKAPEQKLRAYSSILEGYPRSRFAPQARFMIGFVRADELKEYDRAREEFEMFLRDYPEHALAESARWMLDNMDKPDPDLDGMQEIRRRAMTSP